MNLKAEREMFREAFRQWSQGHALHFPCWMDKHHNTDSGGPAAFSVMRPVGSAFKHCAAAAVCFADDAYAVELLSKGCTSLMSRNGRVFFYYEDGYDVLAGTGALAAFRREQEDRLLCSG